MQIFFSAEVRQQHTECKFWSWAGDGWKNESEYGKQCFLKTSDANESNETGFISGPKWCSAGERIDILNNFFF